MANALYVASTNPGKLRDFAIAAETQGIRILTLPELERIPPPAEDALTFEGNARAKASYYSRFCPGEIVLADDSGLEVDALQGAPGVRSARYAADACFCSQHGAGIDSENNLFLLQQLSGVEERTARYRCVLAAAESSTILFTGQGSVEGRILSAPRGSGGFGYDPLFYLPELDRTMAELDLKTKDSLSHRGRAFRALLKDGSGLLKDCERLPKDCERPLKDRKRSA